MLLNGRVSGKVNDCDVPFDKDLYAIINVSGTAKDIEVVNDFIVDDILRAYDSHTAINTPTNVVKNDYSYVFSREMHD